MPFEFVNWGTLEPLTSDKMQDLADNDEFLKKRKIEGRHRRFSGDQTWQKNNLGLYAEYVEISPGDSFPDKQTDKHVPSYFSKKLEIPNKFFKNDRDVLIIHSIGSKPGTLLRATSIVTQVSGKDFDLVVQDSGDTHFTEGMKFFLNFIAIGTVNETVNKSDMINGDYGYKSQSFAAYERIDSNKLNKFVYNSDHFRTNKMDCWMRNVDPLSKMPREAYPILKDNLVMYSDYIVFTPGKSLKNSEGNIKSQFDKRITFPTGFFNIQYQPVVVMNAGIRDGSEYVMMMSILREVRPTSFDVTFIDFNADDEVKFSEDTEMFISYTALGIKGDGTFAL